VTGEERPLQRQVARALRAAGASVGYALRPAGVGKQFKEADARGARATLVLGPDEVAAGVAVLRQMDGGQERRVEIAALLRDGRPPEDAD
jgi:histidyl-tRNA synthetase